MEANSSLATLLQIKVRQERHQAVREPLLWFRWTCIVLIIALPATHDLTLFRGILVVILMVVILLEIQKKPGSDLANGFTRLFSRSENSYLLKKLEAGELQKLIGVEVEEAIGHSAELALMANSQSAQPGATADQATLAEQANRRFEQATKTAYASIKTQVPVPEAVVVDLNASNAALSLRLHQPHAQ